MLKKISIFIILLFVAGAAFIFKKVPLQATINNSTSTTENHILGNEDINENNLINNDKQLIEEIADKDNNKKETNCLEKINKLTKEELQLISGIGETYSKRISKTKNITTIEDLKDIDGIGEVTAGKIKKFVCQNLEEKLNQSKKASENKSQNGNKVNEGDNKVNENIKEEDIIELIELVEEYNNNKEEAREKQKETNNKNVKINSASLEELQKIKGVGPAYSGRIIKNRPFCSLDELVKVKGIGDKTVKEIKDQNLATIEIKCEDKKEVNEKDNNNNEGNEKQSDDSNKKTEKLKEKVNDLEREVSLLEDDYREVRGSLREKERKVKKKTEKIITVQRQRDRCRYPNQININKASIENLEKLSNIGEVKAKKIYDAKDINTLENLKRIDGIDDTIVKDLIAEGIACSWSDEEDNDSDSNESEETDQDDNEEELESVEMNTAEKNKLLQIHGVGEATANNILDYRKENYFCTLSDLEEISGIGETTLQEIDKEGLATVNPPTECFDKEINITNYPEEITLGEEVSIDIKFLDFKESDYKATLRIMAEDNLIEKTKDINLSEENSESFTFTIEEEIDKKLDLEIKVENKEETLSTKEIDSFAEVKTPESKHLTTFEEANKLENVKVEVFKDEDLIFEKLTNGDGLVEKELSPDTYKLKASRTGYKSKEKDFEVEKDTQINVELIRKEFIKNNNFKNWTDESPDNWQLDNQSGKSEKGNLQLGPHDYKGPYEEMTAFTHPESEGETVTYQLNAKVNGTGYIQLGLVRPGRTYASYSNWKLIDNEDWTTIKYELTKDIKDKFDPQGEFIIRHTSDSSLAEKSKEVEEVDIKVDSVSLKVID